MQLPNVIRKEVTVVELLGKHVPADALVLSIGSGNVRLTANSIGLDIQQKQEVDVIGDAHHLPFTSDTFDACVCVGSMQYMRNPSMVVQEMHRVLKDGGWVVVDAPFVQHYCPDKPDLYRFTKAGLEALFSREFEVIDCRVSISGGSALAFYLKGLSGYVARNRVLNAVFQLATSLAVYPLRFMRFGLAHEVAGAHVLVARKRLNGSVA